MILELAYYGDPVLRKKTEKIEIFDDELKQFVKDMEETMFAARGIGLAAPQVHRSVRVFIVNIPEKDEKGEWQPTDTHIFINPKIIDFSRETWNEQEGCLSIPKLYDEINRPIRVTVEAQDLEGQIFTKEYVGWHAKTILHENDHINGVLFIDRIHGKRRKELDPILNQIKRKYYLKK